MQKDNNVYIIYHFKLILINNLLKGSNIIIISSYAGYELDPFPIAFYSLTKTALFALTKILAK